jgi:DNA (cytosine-5)-methyltransferase 1
MRKVIPLKETYRPRIVDFFSGAGGLSAGFCEAGFELIGALDFWKPACDSIQANHPDAYVECGNISKIEPSDFAAKLSGEPDVVLGGPSCQGFSTSSGLGRQGRKEDDHRNTQFQDFVRFVDFLRPKWIVMENVPGLLLYGEGKVARAIVQAFRSIGYNVAPMILLAADFGVPQLRRRLVFVGNRTGKSVAFPQPTNGDPELWKGFALPFEHLSRIGNKNAGSAVAPHVSFDDACSDLPEIEEGETFEGRYPSPAKSDFQRHIRKGSRTLTLHSAFRLSDFDREAISHIKPGQNWRSLPKHLKVGRFAKIREYDATTLLRRLVGHKPSYTITTKFNEATTGAFTHPHQNRTLSIREAARLQSFLDSYKFLGSPVEIRRQIGNAVPPLLAERIATALLPEVLADCGVKKPANAGVQDRLMIDPDVEFDVLVGLKSARTASAAIAQGTLFGD